MVNYNNYYKFDRARLRAPYAYTVLRYEFCGITIHTSNTGRKLNQICADEGASEIHITANEERRSPIN